MEFRDKLISSELRHVTDMVNLLSCELVILQDFLMEVFGPKYSTFRKKHALAGEGVLPLGSGNTISKQAPVVRSVNVNKAELKRSKRKDPLSLDDDSTPQPRSSVGRSRPVDTENNDAVPIVLRSSIHEAATTSASMTEAEGQLDGEVGEEEQQLTFSDLEDLNMEEDEDNDKADEDFDDQLSSQSDCDTKDADWTGFPRRGRRTRNIWLKFNCKKLPDGKREVECRHCGESVSPVAKRLQKHYNKCVLGVSEVSAPVILTPGICKKPKGEIWAHFVKQVTEEGKLLVTCNHCTRRVSNHSTRMSRHLQNCPKFSGIGNPKHDNNDLDLATE